MVLGKKSLPTARLPSTLFLLLLPKFGDFIEKRALNKYPARDSIIILHIAVTEDGPQNKSELAPWLYIHREDL
jgi:hypothetical protein